MIRMDKFAVYVRLLIALYNLCFAQRCPLTATMINQKYLLSDDYSIIIYDRLAVSRFQGGKLTSLLRAP